MDEEATENIDEDVVEETEDLETTDPIEGEDGDNGIASNTPAEDSDTASSTTETEESEGGEEIVEESENEEAEEGGDNADQEVDSDKPAPKRGIIRSVAQGMGGAKQKFAKTKVGS